MQKVVAVVEMQVVSEGDAEVDGVAQPLGAVEDGGAVTVDVASSWRAQHRTTLFLQGMVTMTTQTTTTAAAAP